MKTAELYDSEGNQTKEVFIVMSFKEARSLYEMVEEATEKKIRGAKPLFKKLGKMECW